MKQKITISLPIKSDTCRANAMKIASSIRGVSAVNIDVAKNHLVVTGDGVDSFKLMKSLKWRFRGVSIVGIEEVKPPVPPVKPPVPAPATNTNTNQQLCPPCPPGYNTQCVQYYPVYDQYPPNCSIQ